LLAPSPFRTWAEDLFPSPFPFFFLFGNPGEELGAFLLTTDCLLLARRCFFFLSFGGLVVFLRIARGGLWLFFFPTLVVLAVPFAWGAFPSLFRFPPRLGKNPPCRKAHPLISLFPFITLATVLLLGVVFGHFFPKTSSVFKFSPSETFSLVSSRFFDIFCCFTLRLIEPSFFLYPWRQSAYYLPSCLNGPPSESPFVLFFLFPKVSWCLPSSFPPLAPSGSPRVRM